MALIIDGSDEALPAVKLSGYLDPFQFMELVSVIRGNPAFFRRLSVYDAESLERLAKLIRESQKDA